MIEHDVSSMAEIGSVILREQALVSVDESVKIRFVDGSKWLGSVTISRETADDLSFMVEGIMFSGDVSIPFSVICEPDGPVDWPTRHNGRIYNNNDESEYGNHVSAQFYADGPGWNADNAPKTKPFFASATAQTGEKLASAAEKAQESWQKGRAQVETEGKLRWFTAKELLQADPETDIWPRPMPKPQRVESSGSKKEKSKSKTIKPGIHKRLSTGEKVAVTQSV